MKNSKHTTSELAALLTLPAYPRSAAYDPQWMLENLMGPNALWLAEGLSQVMELRAGMRVLDMGCGKAVSSIFLARDFGVQVWATDLWIQASENWERIRKAGAQDSVFPIHAEAHALPFAHGFFDALVSLDAYHYFGTDDLYLGTFSRFVRPGGQIGIVVPGLRHEFAEGLPDHLASRWNWEWWSFHSPDWWRRHWEKTGLVDIEVADILPDGWQHWLMWEEIARDQGHPFALKDIDILREDGGRNLGFTRVVARRK